MRPGVAKLIGGETVQEHIAGGKFEDCRHWLRESPKIPDLRSTYLWSYHYSEFIPSLRVPINEDPLRLPSI